jgi:hypothetical protein
MPHVESTRRSSLLCLALALIATSISCQTTRGELVPFTEAQRLRYELGESELRSLQYYLSDRIVLERVASKGTGKVHRGRLIVRSGTTIQQVIVETGTRGAVEPTSQIGPSEGGGYAFEVSFDRGVPLRFTATRDGTYSLTGRNRGGFLSRWSRSPRAQVEFDGAKWNVVAGASSHLLIERDALGKLQRTRRVLPGVRVPGAR